jgi:hypothetical protein
VNDLSGDLSGFLSGNQTNLTNSRLLPTTIWTMFVGNVGFLRQKRRLAISRRSANGGLE